MPDPQSNSRPESSSSSTARWGAISALSALLGLRMLGLFMVLPVLALHVMKLPGATSLHAGLALGIYGLTQALFQVPFGRLSDRWGRKPVILAGLALFAAGSVVAALAETPLWLVIGRALQGAGAVSAAVIALVGDLAPAHRRMRAMALVGIVIGVAFMLAFVVGPTLSGWVGVAGLFWITAGFAVVGMLLAAPLDAPPPVSSAEMLSFRSVFPLVAPQAAGVFLLHAIMTATFLAVPLLLVDRLEIPAAAHASVYLPVMLGSLALLAPLILLQERRAHWPVLALAVLALGAGQAGLALDVPPEGFFVALAMSFGGFNFVEARFPTVVSEKAGDRARGSALGIYSAAQFLGAFSGGVAGGITMRLGGPDMLLGANAALAGAWLIALLVPVFRRVQ